MAPHRPNPGSLLARVLVGAAVWHPPAIFGFACFLLSLLWGESAPPVYRAEVVIVGESAELDGVSREIEAWLKSDEVLRAALINTRWPELVQGNSAPDQGRSVAELRERLSVAALCQPDEAPRLAITCTALRSSVALSLANELALQLAEHYEPQRRELARRREEERRDQVQGRLSSARHAEEHQREELERLRHAQLATAMAGARGGMGTHFLSAEESINPRWLELRKQLDALVAQRVEMLEILQPHHPEIEGIDLRIAKISSSLQKTSRKSSQSEPAPSPKVRSASHRRPILEWRKEGAPIARQQYEEEAKAAPISREGLDPVLNMAAQIDEATHQLSVLTSQRKTAEWELASIEQSLAGLAISPGRSWTPQKAVHVVKLGGSYSRLQLWRSAIFAFVAAGMLALVQWKVFRNKNLATLTDILIALPLPIVGRLELAIPDNVARQTPGTAATAFRLLARSSEALAGGILLTCLAASWLDPALGAEIFHDPLEILAETARRVL